MFNSRLSFFVLLCITSLLQAQKSPSMHVTNLNSSKSNLYRVICTPSVANSAQTQMLVGELDKQGALDSATLRLWLPANFKRLGIEPAVVAQISIFTERQYKDCTICRKHCKGRCVQDPGSDCVCIQHSEPNLRLAAGEKMRTLIFLSDVLMDEGATMEAAATTVKSSKSNSSE